MRESNLRRRIAYPVVTLSIAGIIYLYSRGFIASNPPAAAEAYIACARQAVSEARSGERFSMAVDSAIDKVYAANAPDALKSVEGGVPTFEVTGAALEEGERPWIQNVIVRMPDGSGVTLTISIKDGVTQITGAASAEAKSAEGSAQ